MKSFFRIRQDDSNSSRDSNFEYRVTHTDDNRAVRPLESAPRGYPRLAAFMNSDEHFMVYRRFGWLHSRVLMHLQDDVDELELSLKNLDEHEETSPVRRQIFCRNDHPTTQSRRYLPQTITEQLSRYDKMIVGMRSLAETPWPNGCRHKSVREYLYHGPPIYLNHHEIRDHRWIEYEKAVDNILKSPEAGHWLDSPLDQGWSHGLPRKDFRGENNAMRHNHPTWRYRWERVLEQTAITGGILFWILHITSALGFILVDNACGSDDYFLERFVLAYWYLSAMVILVQGLSAKGLEYARKVFVGGILACLGGLYVLRVWMQISQAAALVALPAFFTVAMLLIRTM
ncbi:MAG: hypothetical protein Q9207_005507 [Kuettlingeria erythrocarpa]